MSVFIHFHRQLQAIRLIAFSSVVGSTRETCLAGGLDYSHAELCCHHLLDTVYVCQLFVFIGYWSKTISNFEMIILRGHLNGLTTYNYPVLKQLLTFRSSC